MANIETNLIQNPICSLFWQKSKVVRKIERLIDKRLTSTELGTLICSSSGQVNKDLEKIKSTNKASKQEVANPGTNVWESTPAKTDSQEYAKRIIICGENIFSTALTSTSSAKNTRRKMLKINTTYAFLRNFIMVRLPADTSTTGANSISMVSVAVTCRQLY